MQVAKNLKLSLVLIAALFALAFTLPTVVWAHEGEDHGDDNGQSSQGRDHPEDDGHRSDDHGQAQNSNTENRAEGRKARLADKKLEACQKREQKIKDMMARISARGERQMEVFNKISERTQEFYTTNNLNVDNYDSLVAQVTEKKTEAEAALAKVKETSVEFKCDGSDPKGAAASFKESLKAEIAALKEYKTSIKNLIVAVKSAQTDSEDNSGDDSADDNSTNEGGTF